MWLSMRHVPPPPLSHLLGGGGEEHLVFNALLVSQSLNYGELAPSKDF